MTQLQTLKTNLNQTRIISRNSEEINDDEILLKIERFSFTANNVTYGVAGDTIGYWQFFPAIDDPDNSWGCIPVWGFAEVVTSNNEVIEKGERVFGYFPPSNFLIVKPIKVSPQSFSDGQEHRQELPPVYNNYVRLNSEENYDASMDNIRALLFPLHITAFCLCDALEVQSYEGASQVIIVSASTKTAIGLAQGLAETDGSPKIVGLTSKNNVEFVESLGCYNQVISYDDLGSLSIDSSVIVDMSGNQAVLSSVQSSLGDNMLKCITVGMTHWDKGGSVDEALAQAELQGRTEFFFAPAHIQKRIGDWGHDGYAEKTNAFMTARSQQSRDWMQIKKISGLENFTKIYEEVVAGNINPNEGIIVDLSND